MDRLQLYIEQRAGTDVVRIVGGITEEASLALGGLAEKVGKRCIFNFKGVTVINSAGIRSWVMFLRVFEVGREVIFEDCPPDVVTQINMIPSFTSTARIVSVLAPFVCAGCNDISLVCYDESQYPSPGSTLPAGVCRRCSHPTQLADTVEEFFEFVLRDP